VPKPNKDICVKLEEKNTRNTFSYSMEVKQKALTYHLHLCTPEEIAEKLDLEVATVKEWVSTRFFSDQKNKVIKSIFGNLYSKKAEIISGIIGMGLSILERAFSKILVQMDNPAYCPSLEELQKISSIIGNTNKMLRLEEGKPTEITKHISLKQAKQKIRDLIKSDPFQEFGEWEEEAIEVDEEGNPINN